VQEAGEGPDLGPGVERDLEDDLAVLEVRLLGQEDPAEGPAAQLAEEAEAGDLLASGNSNFTMQLARGVSDQVKVTGNNLDLGSSTLSLSAVQQLQVGDILTIILNGGTDTNFGTFAGLPSGSLINVGGNQVRISYFDNPGTPTFETAGTVGVDPMTNVSLLVTVPEPAAALNLLVGVGGLLGLRRFRRRS